MSETHRAHARAGAAWLALGATVLLLAACGASSNPSAASPSAAAIATAAPSAPAEATPTTQPTAPPLPSAIPRPTDMPTDGTCEEGHACLGLLAAKEYHTDLFEPGFAFTMADDRWENLGMTPGGFDLLSIDAPGDAILFFSHPQATKPDGTRDLSVTMTAAGISDVAGGESERDGRSGDRREHRRPQGEADGHRHRPGCRDPGRRLPRPVDASAC